MASPFYVQMPDLFGGQMAARKAAQEDFASKLSQLYAGGNQQAGKALAGVAPDRAEAIRGALEKMPGTEQAKLTQRTSLLKKWHYAIAQEPDESRRALMWNQMLAQAQQSGADISHIAPSYSAEALQSQTQELLSFEELMGMQKERRLQDSGGGAGTMAERDRQILINGDPNTQEWREVYKDRYLKPKRSFNPVSGKEIIDWEIADPEVMKKAQSIGWPLNSSTQAVFAIESGAPGAPAPGAVQPAKSGTMSVPPSVSIDPGESRAERERIAAEQRAEARKLEEEARKAEKEREQGTAYTADQQKSAGFAARMDQAGRLLGASGDYVPSLKDLYAYRTDPTGFAGSEKSKLHLQAQENWLSANLRKESGAVIGEDEMAREAKKYFPQPGDSSAVIAQKREARRIAEEAMRQAGGGAYTQLSGKLSGRNPAVSPDKKSRAGF